MHSDALCELLFSPHQVTYEFDAVISHTHTMALSNGCGVCSDCSTHCK